MEAGWVENKGRRRGGRSAFHATYDAHTPGHNWWWWWNALLAWKMPLLCRCQRAPLAVCESGKARGEMKTDRVQGAKATRQSATQPKQRVNESIGSPQQAERDGPRAVPGPSPAIPGRWYVRNAEEGDGFAECASATRGRSKRVARGCVLLEFRG